MRLVGRSDQGGRPDATQMVVCRDHAYIGHLYSGGLSVLDVSDPRDVRATHFEAAPTNTWNIHLQTADDLMTSCWSATPGTCVAQFRDESEYYGGSLGSKLAGPRRSWSAGPAVYDISRHGAPRRIGFLPVEGVGVHRKWYPGGRWAYVSPLLDGYTDYVLLTIDLADPPPTRSRLGASGCSACTPPVASSRRGTPSVGATRCTTRSSPEIPPTPPGETED